MTEDDSRKEQVALTAHREVLAWGFLIPGHIVKEMVSDLRDDPSVQSVEHSTDD